MSQIYPGLSIFPATKDGAHNWLENQSRPMANACLTNKKGKKRWFNLFLNKKVSYEITSEEIVLRIPLAEKKPFLHIAFKD